VFSQAHLRVYFIGIVKLALVAPATMRIAIPDKALLMMGFLLLTLGHVNGRIFQGRAQKIDGESRLCDT
jgi:hypothetical protein